MTKYQESLFRENLEMMYLSLAERVLGHKINLVADVNYIHHRSVEPPPHFLKIVRTPGSKKLNLL